MMEGLTAHPQRQARAAASSTFAFSIVISGASAR